jgi:hypothetical protein
LKVFHKNYFFTPACKFTAPPSLARKAAGDNCSKTWKEELMAKDDLSVIEKILSSVGKPVNFNFPGSEPDKKGILKDRCVMPSETGETGVPYWDVVDLIEFPVKKDPLWIRFGYYRAPEGKLGWGSQTTITEPIRIWKSLLIKAAREKLWFKQLLMEVMREIGE